MAVQAVVAGFLHVYEESHRRKIFPRLGNSHLSHISSLMSSRSLVQSAAFPTDAALAGSVPSFTSPRYPFQVPGIANSMPKPAEMENCC